MELVIWKNLLKNIALIAARYLIVTPAISMIAFAVIFLSAKARFN